MIEIINFWWHCARIGWETGDGVFAFLELLFGAILIVLLALQKIKPKDHKDWEDAAAKYTLYLFIATFILSTFLIAPFLQFHEADEAKMKAQNALNHKSPKLDGFVNQSMIWIKQGTKITIVILQMSVRNSGAYPSIAEGYKLSVTLTNNTTLQANPMDIGEQYN